MIYEYLGLLLASLGMGVAIAYSLWAWVRVKLLREDLFVIRDGLWDSAERLGRLDDPAYQAVREKLHLLIQGGPFMSVPMLAAGHTDQRKTVARRESDSPDFESILSEAEEQALKRMLVYICRDRFASCLTWLLWMRSLRIIQSSLSRWLNSDGPKKMAAVARYQVRPRRRVFSSAH